MQWCAGFVKLEWNYEQDGGWLLSVKRLVTRSRNWDQHRVDHYSSSMGTFAAMLGPYFKSCKGFDFGIKPLDLPFESRNATEFSSRFAARFFLLQENFSHCMFASAFC